MQGRKLVSWDICRRAVGTSTLSYEQAQPPSLNILIFMYCITLLAWSFQPDPAASLLVFCLKLAQKVCLDNTLLMNNTIHDTHSRQKLAMVGTLQTGVKVLSLLMPILLFRMFLPTLFWLLLYLFALTSTRTVSHHPRSRGLDTLHCMHCPDISQKCILIHMPMIFEIFDFYSTFLVHCTLGLHCCASVLEWGVFLPDTTLSCAWRNT